MKFGRTYQEYMQKKKLPGIGFKKLKKVLKKCPRREFLPSKWDRKGLCDCPQECPVCDGTFFSSLLKEMTDIVGCFNNHAQKLLEMHLASGLQKYLIWFRNKQRPQHASLVQEGKDLVTYAMVNSIAIHKILKKYDKAHCSKKGQAFRSQAQSMHIEILKSPWLRELIALHINLRETKATEGTLPGLLEGCQLISEDCKPSLSFSLSDSVKLNIELTCSICLDTVFDPVSLSCSHIFCYMCACSAASVTIVDGLKAADPKGKCPLCRETGVYKGAVHMEELNILLSRSCPEYWKQRRQTERVERIRQAKEYWESQSRAFLGI